MYILDIVDITFVVVKPYFILFKNQYIDIVLFDIFSFQSSEIEHYLHLFNIALC